MIHTFFLLNVYTGMYKNKDIQYKVIEKPLMRLLKHIGLKLNSLKKKQYYLWNCL